MSDFAISSVETGKLNALVKNIMKQTGIKDPNTAVRMVNNGRFHVTRKRLPLTRKDNEFTLHVTSRCYSGMKWHAYFKEEEFHLMYYAVQILVSPTFEYSQHGEAYEVHVLKSDSFVPHERTLKSIWKYAHSKGYQQCPAEVGCLMRELLVSEDFAEMGLQSIVVMHQPLMQFDDYRLDYALCLERDGRLDTVDVYPHREWNQGYGFAFISRQGSNGGFAMA